MLAQQNKRPQLIGAMLVGLGILFLLGNLGLFGAIAGPFWALVFGAGGVAFLMLFYTRREHWWALIPGFALLALAAAILGGSAAGSLFLGLLGLGFLGVYLSDSQRWWAVIPAGALLTLAMVAAIGEGALAWSAGPLFFLGLAATFGALFFLPEERGKQRWAIYPALGLLVLAVLSMNLFAGSSPVAWSILLIAGGVFLLWRNQRSRNKPSSEG